MPKFILLTVLKDTTGIVDFCQECGEPAFVTRNGTPELVIMDSEFFDKYLRYRDSSGKLDIRREFAQIPETITIKELKNTGELSEHCRGAHGPVSIEGYCQRHAALWGQASLHNGMDHYEK